MGSVISLQLKFVACFYEYTDSFLIKKNNNRLYDIIRKKPLRGEDDITFLRRESERLGFGNLNNFRRMAAIGDSTYYASELRDSLLPKGIRCITPAEALDESFAKQLRPGLAEIIRQAYQG
jgi:hypothetical protein